MANFFTTAKYRPHSRKDHRYEIPKLHLKIADQEFDTYDWSLGGFRIDDYKGRPPVGELVTISQMAYAPDTTADVHATAVVTRILLGKNQVAFAFNKLDDKSFDLLEVASMRRLSQLADR
ncbi:PilZ domain-containing protein [Sneathiella marina]|uniref:PilZ domain-containing protein n=1 Tax=Sneathiella marina TaxID=2950108 RepID=A0ABY4W7U8_9PROT|nr:PilZ domain-containing protein [Sneathiella marina]USG62198.1 PilZ domain-containing protein [Sneathiella marina]